MKSYRTQTNVGKARHTVSFHDGKKKHGDGSPFYDLRIFGSRKKRDQFVCSLELEGFTDESKTVSAPMKLYAVVSINRRTKKETPRHDLAPMNHQAACNWMQACRTEHTDHRLTPWPDDIPHGEPLIAQNYRK